MSNLVISALQVVGSASRTTVRVELTDSRGDAIIGYVTGTDDTVIAPSVFHTDTNGQLTIDLVPTSDITPGNSCYTVTVGSKSFLIQKSGATQNLFEAVIVNPGDLDPITTGVLLAENNLSDVQDAETSRGNLGLGNSATLDVGVTAGTVAAGDDPRFDTIVTDHGDLTGLTDPDVHPATSISSVPTGFLTGTEVQTNISELVIEINDVRADGAADLAAHVDDTTDAHDASAVSVVPTVDLLATDVQGALEELQTEIIATTAQAAAALAAHVDDTTDAHDASAISVVPVDDLSSTDIQAALEELSAEGTATAAGLQAHVAATTDAHDASAISVVPSGGLVADDVQEALEELDSESAATAAGLAAHLADTDDAHDASAISFVPFATIEATNVQDAIEEVFNEAAGSGGSGTFDHNELFNRDAADQHPASSVTNTPAGTISSTTVQAAINELDGDIQGHITDAVDAHDASAISFVPADTIAATDAQAAIVEALTDARAYTDLHIADTVDAHDASAISVVPFATISATDVQAALEEIVAEGGGTQIAADTPFTPAGDITSTNVQAAIEEVDAELHAHEADTVDAHDATAISFAPTGDIAATDVQTAIVEVDGELHAHETDTVDAHDASAISFVPTGTIAATNAQDAISEAYTDAIAYSDAALNAHLTDTTDAHDASAVSFVPTGDIVATDVQAAIVEVDTELHAHEADTVDAHDASAISFAPTGDLSSTDVQAAIVEVDGEFHAHLTDTVDAHDATAISTTTFGTITATDVQNSLEQVYAAATAGLDEADEISFSPAAGISATNVQAAIEEVVSDADALYVRKNTTYAATGTDVLRTFVTGDTNNRLALDADGTLNWGPGNAGTDTTLFRPSAGGYVQTNVGFWAADSIRTVNGGFELGTSGLSWTKGTGSPEGAVTAPRGSMFSRTDGGTGTTLYFKESGTGNTGWVAKDAAVDAHIADTTNAHLASSIGFSPTGTISSTNSQAAIAEVSGDVATVASDLAAHLADTTDAHDASAISFVSTGTVAAGDVQTAIAEVATDAIAREALKVDSDGSYAATTTDALKTRVTSDANPRFTLNADGLVEWGSGSAAADTNLYRSAANTLKTDDTFETADGINAAGTITSTTSIQATTNFRLGSASGPRWLQGTGTPEGAVTGSVGDFFTRTNGSANTTLYVKESGTSTNTGWVAYGAAGGGTVTASAVTVTPTGNLSSTNVQSALQELQGDIDSITPGGGGVAVDAAYAATTTDVLKTRITTDTSGRRWILNADGMMEWGAGGGSATDVTLYRSAANILKTDDGLFIAGAIGTDTVLAVNDNTQQNFSGSTNGYGIKSLPLHNSSGNLIGIQSIPKHGNTGSVSHMKGIEVSGSWSKGGSSSTLTQWTGVHLTQPTGSSTSDFVTTAYGVLVDSQAPTTTTTSTSVGMKIAAQGGSTAIGMQIETQTTNTLWLASSTNPSTAAGGIVFGSSKDTNLYRSAADTLKTDDTFIVNKDAVINGAISTNIVLTVNDGTTQNFSSSTTGYGISTTPFHAAFGDLIGIRSTPKHGSGSSGSASNMKGIEIGATWNKGGTGSVLTQWTGVHLTQPVGSSFSDSVTTAYGVLVDSQAPSTTSVTTATGIKVAAQTGSVSTAIGVQIETQGTNTLWLGSSTNPTTQAGGIVFGSSKDTNLYRSAANTLKTDDGFHASGGFGAFSTAPVTTQYSSAGNVAGFTAGGGTTVTSTSTFTGNTGSIAYTITDIVRALKLYGLMAS